MSAAISETSFSETQSRDRSRSPSRNEYKVISVRLRAAEYEAFSEEIREFGLTSNMALRVAARRIGGFLEIDSKSRDHLQEITKRIGTIADGVSELNQLATKSGTIDMDAFQVLRTSFGQEFAKLDGLLRRILNVSCRRRDGAGLVSNSIG